MNNLEIRQFSIAITNFINQNQLPMEVKRLVLKDILNQVETETNKMITEEFKNIETQNAIKEESETK